MLSRPEGKIANDVIMKRPDLADVKGQKRQNARWKLPLLGHNLLMMGPPGSGEIHAGELFAVDFTAFITQGSLGSLDDSFFKRNVGGRRVDEDASLS